jgi:hypothetical protein
MKTRIRNPRRWEDQLIGMIDAHNRSRNRAPGIKSDSTIVPVDSDPQVFESTKNRFDALFPAVSISTAEQNSKLLRRSPKPQP